MLFEYLIPDHLFAVRITSNFLERCCPTFWRHVSISEIFLGEVQSGEAHMGVMVRGSHTLGHIVCICIGKLYDSGSYFIQSRAVKCFLKRGAKLHSNRAEAIPESTKSEINWFNMWNHVCFLLD